LIFQIKASEGWETGREELGEGMRGIERRREAGELEGLERGEGIGEVGEREGG